MSCNLFAEGQARELPLDLDMVHGLSKSETRSYIVSDTLKGAECRQAAKALQAASFKGMIPLNHGDYAEQSLQEDIAAVYDALVKGLSLGVKKGEGAMKDEGKKLLRDVRADPIMDDSFMEMMYYESQPMFVKATAYSMAALHDAASATLKVSKHS